MNLRAVEFDQLSCPMFKTDARGKSPKSTPASASLGLEVATSPPYVIVADLKEPHSLLLDFPRFSRYFELYLMMLVGL